MLSLLLASCGKKAEPLSPAQVRQKADSLAQIKIKIIQQRAEEDLEKRRAIELKPMVDSLRNISTEIPPPPTMRQDGMYEDADEATLTADSTK